MTSFQEKTGERTAGLRITLFGGFEISGADWASTVSITKKARALLVYLAMLEGAPDWIDEEELKIELAEAIPEVRSVHHVHAWMLTQEHPLITMHALISEEANHNETLVAITRFLKERYAITHATVQIETGDCIDDIESVLGHPHDHDHRAS